MGKFLSFLWRLIGILSVLVITAFIWLFFFVPKPETVSTTYINTLSAFDKEDVALEDSTIVLDIQLLKNSDNSGQALFETGFTTYQGTNTEEKFTKGIQILGDFNSTSYLKYHSHRNHSGWWIFESFDTYDFYDLNIDNLYSYDISYDNDLGVAYSSPTAFDSNTKFIVSVGSGENLKLAQLRFKNEELTDKHLIETKGFEWRECCVGDGCKVYQLISLNYMLQSIYNSVNSLDIGTYFITFDLSEFFDIYLQNEDGQFEILTQDEQYTFVTARVNVEDNGIVTKQQSMFGMIAQNNGSISFELDGTEKLFWKTYENINIENTFELRYSEYYQANLLHITNETITKLKDYENLRIHLIIDLSKYDNVIGIDSFGLDGLNYYDITIKGNSQDFYFMSNSLVNTKVNTIYHSEDVNVIIYDTTNINLQVVA